MTDREAMKMALNALEFSLPAIEDFGSKEQLTDCHRAIMALYKSLAQPEQKPFKPDWVSYRQGVVDGAAQPEQEEPLPLVDIGVDVTPEGTHVVACYNRPDAVQEMFYSQFHPLTKPEQEPDAWRNAAVRLGEDLYSVGPDGYYNMTAKQWLDWALGVVNAAPPKPKQESISTNEHLCAMLRQVHDVLACTALPMKRKWVGLTDDEIEDTWGNTPMMLNARDGGARRVFARAIEAKLKEKNT